MSIRKNWKKLKQSMKRRGKNGSRWKRCVRPSFEVLEDRKLLTTTLYLDYGDRFPGGVLQTTKTENVNVGTIDSTTSGTNPDMDGPALLNPMGNPYANNTAVTIQSFANVYGAGTAATQMRDTMNALVRRFFEPLDVNVVELTDTSQNVNGQMVQGADSLADISQTLGVTASNDAYIIIGLFNVGSNGNPRTWVDNPMTPATESGYGGLAPLDNGNNNDDTGLVLLLNGGDTAEFLGVQIAHEAGHLLGLAHSFGDNPVAPPAGSGIDAGLLQSDIMSYLAYTTFGGFNVFSRYPMVAGNGNTSNNTLNETPTAYDTLINSTDLDNPDWEYVTGTGRNDIITITKGEFNQATVSVQAFSDSSYKTPIPYPGPNPSNSSIYSYSINLDKPILIDAGARNDRIILSANLGVSITVRGMHGTDELIVNGLGADTAAYKPGSDDSDGPDGNSDLRGALAVGNTTINFQEFESNSQITLSNVKSLTFDAPLKDDVITLSNPTTGQTRLSGTSSSVTGPPIDFVPLNFYDVGDFTLDTYTSGGYVGKDKITIIAIDPSFTGGLTIKTGTGDDEITVESLPGGVDLNIDSQLGSDKIHIATTGNGAHLENVQGTVTINGGWGAISEDTLYLHDESHLLGETYTITSTEVTRTGAGKINYSEVEHLVLNAASSSGGGLGDNFINLQSAGSSKTTTINGGAGRDNITVSSAASTIATINGDGGNDEINVHGAGSVETMSINGGADEDIINIYATTPATATTANGGGGSDQINIGFWDPQAGVAPNIAGDVVVNGGLGSDIVTLGNGNAVDIKGSVTVNGDGPSAVNNPGDTDELIVNDQNLTTFEREYTITSIQVEIQPIIYELVLPPWDPTDPDPVPDPGVPTLVPPLVFGYGMIENVVLNTGAYDPYPPGGIKPLPKGSAIRVEGAATGAHVIINAAAGNDVITVEGSGVNSNVTVHGNGGKDEVTVNGASGAAELRPLVLKLTTSGGHTLTVDGSENIEVNSGGGNNTAIFYDSHGNDRFVATNERATMTGTVTFSDAAATDYVNVVNNFAEVQAFADADPSTNDVATLTDPTGKAKFSRTARYVEMDARPTFFVSATDFDQEGTGFVVTNTTDSGPGSLRQAIQAANSNPGADTIIFNIPGVGPHTIRPGSALPTITDPAIIDGYTQPGATPNTLAAGNNANLLIELDGTNAGANTHGLTIDAGNSMLRGLVINRFSSHGISIVSNGGNVIEGNFIGTDVSGISSLGNADHGVIIQSGAANNTIGGATAAERNIISGNQRIGVLITGIGASGNVIAGNYVGTDVSGTLDRGNGQHGVLIRNGAKDNVVGGTATGAGNLISGNDRSGVTIANSGTENNRVEGNLIGADVSGKLDLGNSRYGVDISRAANNTIGGSVPAARNTISGNDDAGVIISGSGVAGTSGNIVAGNFIGVDQDGKAPLGNAHSGVRIEGGAQNNIIGANGDGIGDANEGNVISGNKHAGVWITNPGSDANVVAGNLIGTDKTGLAPMGNGNDGLLINDGAASNRIGTDANGTSDKEERNVIADNPYGGVRVVASTSGNAPNNIIAGNYIGLLADGDTAIGNGGNQGVELVGVTGTIVGGSTAAARNIISGHAKNGILITGAGASGNFVQGNYIGTDVTGTLDRGNGADGVRITGGAKNNTVGGATAAERNIISGNQRLGVLITGVGTDGNVIVGNYVGTDASGTQDVGNMSAGVWITNGAKSNLVGGTATGAGNLISGNDLSGVGITNSGTEFNRVEGNLIGVDVSGALDLGNSRYGVDISQASNNTIGGAAPGAGNIISGNDDDGVIITGLGGVATGNVVAGNYIGTDINGAAVLGNRHSGVLIEFGASDNIIGLPGAGNVLSGNQVLGVHITESARGNLVQGNYIGTNAVGADLGNRSAGVELSHGAIDNIVGTDGDGASDAEEGNVIAWNNGFAGVAVFNPTSVGNLIRGNSIYSNGGLGIDLITAGERVTPNDSLDADTGPNTLQNYPELFSVEAGAATRFTGVLKSTPNSTFTLDFYASPFDAASMFQGARYLGSVSGIQTNAAGDAPIDVTLTASVGAGEVVTATATSASGDTSEFSFPLSAESPSEPASFQIIDRDPSSSQDPLQMRATDQNEIITVTQASEMQAVVSVAPRGRPNEVQVKTVDMAGGLMIETAGDDRIVVDTALSANVSIVGVGATELMLQGRADDDAFHLQQGEGNELFLRINGAVRGPFMGITQIVGYGAEGNDRLTVGDGVAAQIEFHGGPGDDRLYGGEGDDRLFGDEGIDVLVGKDGDDMLDGGADNDRLYGVRGDDRMFGGAGRDVLFAAYGDDYLEGNEGNDVLYGQSGYDIAYGGEGNDILNGGRNDDLLFGGAGRDKLLASYGNDVLVGGDASDRLYGHLGRNLLIGGDGRDLLSAGKEGSVLISGTTVYDDHAEALATLLTEWASPRSLSDRTTNLQHGVGATNGQIYSLTPSQTVFDDGDSSLLVGGAGEDWFWPNTTDALFDEEPDRDMSKSLARGI